MLIFRLDFKSFVRIIQPVDRIVVIAVSVGSVAAQIGARTQKKAKRKRTRPLFCIFDLYAE